LTDSEMFEHKQPTVKVHDEGPDAGEGEGDLGDDEADAVTMKLTA